MAALALATASATATDLKIQLRYSTFFYDLCPAFEIPIVVANFNVFSYDSISSPSPPQRRAADALQTWVKPQCLPTVSIPSTRPSSKALLPVQASPVNKVSSSPFNLSPRLV